MKTKTQVRTAPAVALRRVAAVAVVLLAFCLVFMAPVAADATVDANGDLATAITSAGAGGTVTLNGDITVPNGITLGQDVTLNLGEHTITYTGTGDNALFTVNAGNLTINAGQNGGITTEAVSKYGYIVNLNTASPASLTVNGGTYSQTGDAAVLFLISLDEKPKKQSTITGATISGKKNCVQVSGYADVIIEDCTITVTKSSYSGSGDYYCHGIFAAYGGTVLVKGGSVTSDGVALASWYTNGEITVEDATITGSAAALQAMPAADPAATPFNNNYPYMTGKSSITVSSGTVNGIITTEQVSLDGKELAYSNTGSVDPDIIINGGTFIVSTEQQLRDVLSYIAEGATGVPTIQLANGIESLSGLIFIDKPVTITGGESMKKITRVGAAEYACIFSVTAGDTTFRNLELTSAGSKGMCIHTTNDVNVAINDCKLTAENGNSQPLTIENGNTVTLSNTIINAGDSGYGIITFNPVTLNIRDNSEITGYAALYMKGAYGTLQQGPNGEWPDVTELDNYKPNDCLGSAGSHVTITDSKLYGYNNHEGNSNNFGLIVIEDTGITITLTSSTLGEAKAEKSAIQGLILFSLEQAGEGPEGYEGIPINGLKAKSGNTIIINSGVSLYANGDNAEFVVNAGENVFTIADGVLANKETISKIIGAEQTLESTADGMYKVVAKDYTISTDVAKVGFDSVKVGYTQPEAQTVTITNDGNVPVNIEAAISDKYEVSLDKTELSADGDGEKAVLTIRPKAGHAVGNYEDILIIKVKENGKSYSIPVSFLVYQPSSGGSSTTKPEEPVEPETPVEPENPTEEPEAGEPSVETEVTDGGEVLFEAPVEPETPGADTPSDEPAEPAITGVVLPEGTDSEVAFIPVSEKPAPAGKETQTKKVFEINVPKYEKGKPATVKFTMTVAELAADGKTAADVALWHQDEETGEWTKLVTTFVIIDGVVYFEAITFDFSPFAIVYEDVSAPTEPETPEQPTESPAPILAVLAGLGAAVVLRRK